MNTETVNNEGTLLSYILFKQLLVWFDQNIKKANKGISDFGTFSAIK